MISIQKNFIFIHVPKTGGNSIQNILKDYSEDDIVALAEHQDGIERFDLRNKNYNTHKHSTIAEYKAELDSDFYASAFKFAAIRNPWDRMVSAYFAPHRGTVKWDRKAFLSLMYDLPTIRHYMCEGPLANRLDADLDFLIRFEQLDRDFDTVCEHIGLPKYKLPKRNQSIRGHYSEYYDDELRSVVARKFKEEIELGNYSFEQKPGQRPISSNIRKYGAPP